MCIKWITIIQLRALEKKHKLRDYSRLKKAELIAFLRKIFDQCASVLQGPLDLLNHPHLPSGLDQIGQGNPILEKWIYLNNKRWEKYRPQVKSKLNDWHNWLVNYVPKTIKDKASKAFKSFKDKVMGLFGRSEGKDQAYQQRPKRDNEEPMEEFPPNDQKKLK